MPGQWPPKDLFDEDFRTAPLLSPFATGSGVDAFLKLIDTPATFSGQTGKVVAVNTAENSLEFIDPAGFSPDHTFIVDPTGAVTSFDGTAYTAIQDALDAANALTPSITNQYLVLIVPGLYNMGTDGLTLYSHVHVTSLQGVASPVDSRASVAIGLGGGSGNSMDSVDDCQISGIHFYYNGQVGHTDIIDVVHDDFSFVNCSFAINPSVGGVELFAGKHYNCHFINCDLEVGGGSTAPMVLSDSYIEQSGGALTDAGGLVHFNNVDIFADSSHTAASFMTINNGISNSFVMTGGSIRCLDGGTCSLEGRYVGVTMDFEQQASLSSQVRTSLNLTGGFEAVGCDIQIRQVTTGNTATVGAISIGDFVGGDIALTGCNVYTSGDNPLFMLDDGLTGESNFLRISGSSLANNDTSSWIGHLFAVHSSGFTGTVTVQLNGNRYLANGVTGPEFTMPANPGTGRLRWHGSDVQSIFYPVDSASATAMVTVGNFPAAELDAGAEVATVTGRNAPPSGILVDAALVISGENSDGIQTDDFTDTDSTPIASHSPTGGTGTWTLVSGTILITSNKADGSSVTGTSIATYSITGKNGYISCVGTANSGTGVNRGGVVFRYADTSNYWMLVNEEGSPKLIKRVAGSETTVMIPTGAALACSFNGPLIRVYNSAGHIVGEVEDSDLEDNSTVGILTAQLSGRNQTVDDFEWHPGGDVDVTVSTAVAQKHQPFPTPTDSDDDGVNVMHRAYSLHPISDIGLGEDLWSVLTTLDVLNGNITDLRVHGVIVRHLPVETRHGVNASTNATPDNGFYFQ